MWIAVGFLFLLSYDVWLALWFTDATIGPTRSGIDLGTIVLAANVVLLSCYTLGCHVHAAYCRRVSRGGVKVSTLRSPAHRSEALVLRFDF